MNNLKKRIHLFLTELSHEFNEPRILHSLKYQQFAKSLFENKELMLLAESYHAESARALGNKLLLNEEKVPNIDIDLKTINDHISNLANIVANFADGYKVPVMKAVYITILNTFLKVTGTKIKGASRFAPSGSEMGKYAQKQQS